MPKKIKKVFDKALTYEKLLEAHELAKVGKSDRVDVIEYDLKKEMYTLWLLDSLKNGTYKHGGYTTFYITEPKLRKVEKAKYVDRVVHRWLFDNFLKPYFEVRFSKDTYACIEGRGMHLACLDVKKMLRILSREWGEFYILKMDVAKYFESINRDTLFFILQRKIGDKKLLSLIKDILDSSNGENGRGIPIRQPLFSVLCKCIFRRSR